MYRVLFLLSVCFAKDYNHIYLNGTLSLELIREIGSQIVMNEKQNTMLHIHSEGGNIGLAYKLASLFKWNHVECIATFASGTAFDIFQHCSVRYIIPKTVLYRQPLFSPFSYDATSEMQLMNDLSVKMNMFIANRINIPLESYEEAIQRYILFHEPSTILSSKLADEMYFEE
jgi:hypothetical protein